LQPDHSARSTRLDRRQYLRHFLIILGGNGAAQAINLLGYPFLARLYSPHEFGLFGIFTAAVAIPGMVACGRFEFAIPTAPKRGAAGVLWLAVLTSAAIGILSTAGAEIYWWANPAAGGAALPLLLGLCVFLTGICAATSMFLMRHDGYRSVSASILVRTVVAILSQVVLAFAAGGAISLIVGFTLSLVAQAAMLVTLTWRRINPGPPRRPIIVAMFARYRRQVSVDFPSTLVGALALNILTFALAILYDPGTVGFYSIGNRLAVVPLALFNDALAQVFFQKASRAKEQKGHLWDELKFNLLTSSLLSLGVLVGIVVLARPFIGIFLGERWLPAADMLIILSPMLAMRALVMSIGTTVFVLRSAHWLFVHNVATVVIPLLALAIAWSLHLSPLMFLGIVSATLAIEYAAFGLFLTLAVRRDRASAGA
jgi:O-antigen/teichoic acid export membrane protein